MTALYEISKEILAINDIDDEGDESLKEAITNSLDDLKMDFNEKIDNIIKFSKSIDGDISSIDTEIERLKKRRTSFANKQEQLKNYVITNLKAIDQKSIKTPLFTVSTYKGRDKVVVDDVSKIPNSYIGVRVVETPNKVELLKALKAGQEIPGCHIEQSDTTLKIK